MLISPVVAIWKLEFGRDRVLGSGLHLKVADIDWNDEVLFNLDATLGVRSRLSVPDSQSVADFMLDNPHLGRS